MPTAPEDGLAVVVWHFVIDDEEAGIGTLNTMGPIKAGPKVESYPQDMIGGTGKFKSVKGTATTTVLGAGGFHFRMSVSNSNR